MTTNTFGRSKVQYWVHSFSIFISVEPFDIASYAGDTTPYVCCENIDLIIEKLEIKANSKV